ncbi:MAG: U32 family peptidase, partial [Lentisphaeria bacterium]|nr:U32 family peptidase [Lentisphaeria bacterium]
MIDSLNIEILAPVGNQDALNAAINQQANAVYFGLTSINARRGAANFEPSELQNLVKKVHQANAKAYLALNITLTDREVGKAYRIVELAAQSKVDAIIICDPALLFLVKLYPNLEFHFSTQAACSNEEDMNMAKELGIHRVVLARENSIDEIKTMTQVGVDT